MVRSSLALLALLASGCQGRCTGIDDPDNLWSRAASVRVDVYGAGPSCQNNQIVSGGAVPQITRVYDPHQSIQIDLTHGVHVLALTLYSDPDRTMVLATACISDDVRADICLRFSLRSSSDGGCQSNADCVGDGGASLCCGHRCVDPDSDPENCGGCAMVCNRLHTVMACSGGSCSSDCEPGWAHCDGELQGCETNLAQAGLKTCNGACIDASTCCTADDCTFPPGPAACFAPACSSAGGQCLYPTIPGSALCGSLCCLPSHAQCGSDCSLSCATGWVDCDGTPASGCECQGDGCCNGACQVQHDNGEGQSWFDCVALDTHDQAQEQKACAAFTGDPTQCHAGSCGVCSDGSATACDCWMDDGKVKENPVGSCGCKGASNTKAWN
jgi:hypothetical protein